MDAEEFATLTMQRLVDRIQDGDRRAQDELLRRVGDRLERLARKMLQTFPGVRRWEQPEDVLQNASLRLLKALAVVRPENTRAFFGLAAEQLRRQLLDLNRHYQGALGHGRHLPEQPARVLGGESMSAFDPVDQALDSAHITELDRWQALHEAVDLLRAEEREVFGMIFYQGCIQSHVASLMQISDRTVRRHWQSACLRLKELLKGDLPS